MLHNHTEKSLSKECRADHSVPHSIRSRNIRDDCAARNPTGGNGNTNHTREQNNTTSASGVASGESTIPMPCHDPNTRREIGAIPTDAAHVVPSTRANHFGMKNPKVPAIGVEQTMMTNKAQYERSAPVEFMVQGNAKTCTMQAMANNCRLASL